MSKNSEDVLADLILIMRQVFENNTVQAKRETTARDIKEWDSLNHLELVASAERHFGIRFNFAELEKFKNVGEMCDNIAAKLAKSS